MSEKSCSKNMPHACGYDIYNSHSEKRQPSLVIVSFKKLNYELGFLRK